jgi:hypothetical protein
MTGLQSGSMFLFTCVGTESKEATPILTIERLKN